MQMSRSNHPEAFAPVCAALHGLCFEKPWGTADFAALLALPTSRLFMREEGFLLAARAADEMEILTLCVAPDARRKGVATQLLNALADEAERNQVKRIFLEVAADNAAAAALYLKNGFVQNGVRKGYYATPRGAVNALRFVKETAVSG